MALYQHCIGSILWACIRYRANIYTVSKRHQVALYQHCIGSILGASYTMLVLDEKGLHIVFTFFKMGREIALSVKMIGYFCLSHLVEVSVLRTLKICFTLLMATIIYMYCKNVSFGFIVISKTFRCFVVPEFDCLIWPYLNKPG